MLAEGSTHGRTRLHMSPHLRATNLAGIAAGEEAEFGPAGRTSGRCLGGLVEAAGLDPYVLADLPPSARRVSAAFAGGSSGLAS
jgi:hypothetical protein